MRLLGYPGWLLGSCYAVARLPGVVARVFLPKAQNTMHNLKNMGKTPVKN